MPDSTRRGSNSICRRIRAWRSPPAGIGSASCRRASSPATMPPPSRRQRRRNACSGRRLHSSSWRSTISTPRWRRPHSAMRPPPRSGPAIWRPWPLTTASSSNGPKTARRTSRTAPHWSAPRSPALKAASSTRCVSTNRPSARRATTALSTTKRSPTNCAARFYAARGFDEFATVYLRDARYGYLRWGADGKVRQLDQLYPHLREEEQAPGPTSTIGAPVEQLDLATVIKVSQTVSGEIVLEKLLDTLLRTAIEHAGADARPADHRARGGAADRGGSQDRAATRSSCSCATSR